jgi:hypothetical protein
VLDLPESGRVYSVHGKSIPNRNIYQFFCSASGELARYPALLYNTVVESGSLKTKLNWLESRLQRLIEGSVSRLLPHTGNGDLPSNLINAMYEGLQKDQDGVPLAPDLFTLKLSPEDARRFEEDRTVLPELANAIEQAGGEAGFRFLAKPKLKLDIEPAISSGCFEILAQIGQQAIEETGIFGITPEEVSQAVPEGAFLILNSAQVYPLIDPVVNIGRQSTNHLVVEDVKVSRTHAQLRAIKGRYVIFDLESSGGTFVNGSRTGQRTLFPGDVISLAGVSLVYGQDAGFLSGDPSTGTQPIVPFPSQS